MNGRIIDLGAIAGHALVPGESNPRSRLCPTPPGIIGNRSIQTTLRLYQSQRILSCGGLHQAFIHPSLVVLGEAGRVPDSLGTDKAQLPNPQRPHTVLYCWRLTIPNSKNPRNAP